MTTLVMVEIITGLFFLTYYIPLQVRDTLQLTKIPLTPKHAIKATTKEQCCHYCKIYKKVHRQHLHQDSFADGEV